MNQIDEDLKESKREIREIKSIGGQIKNSLTSSKYEHSDRNKTNNKENSNIDILGKKKMTIDELLEQKKLEKEQEKKKNTFQQLIEYGQFDHLSSDSQYQMRETEQTIDVISSTVHEIKGIAVLMSDNLDEQNKLIDELQSSTSNSNSKIKKMRSKIKREF